MTEFHKLQVAPDHATPVNAYVIDDDGTKRAYKFSFLNEESNFETPGGVLVPNSAHHDESDENDLRIAATGVRQYSTYEVELEPFLNA